MHNLPPIERLEGVFASYPKHVCMSAFCMSSCVGRGLAAGSSSPMDHTECLKTRFINLENGGPKWPPAQSTLYRILLCVSE
jgi:hypothetical protein